MGQNGQPFRSAPECSSSSQRTKRWQFLLARVLVAWTTWCAWWKTHPTAVGLVHCAILCLGAGTAGGAMRWDQLFPDLLPRLSLACGALAGLYAHAVVAESLRDRGYRWNRRGFDIGFPIFVPVALVPSIVDAILGI